MKSEIIKFVAAPEEGSDIPVSFLHVGTLGHSGKINDSAIVRLSDSVSRSVSVSLILIVNVGVSVSSSVCVIFIVKGSYSFISLVNGAIGANGSNQWNKWMFQWRQLW